MIPDALCKHFVFLDADNTTMGEFCLSKLVAWVADISF